MLTMCCLYVHE